VGYCRLRAAIRAFRVDRIRQLELLETTFQRPADFDARQYLTAELQGAQVPVRLRFAPAAGHLALNNPAGWETVEPQTDGAVCVTLALPDLLWAASLALSFGPAVTVEEPEALRRLVREWAQAVARLYADGDSP
jgi:predicted DNA-binding transcriptional regulator YafY